MKSTRLVPALLLLLALTVLAMPAAAGGPLKIFGGQFCLDVTGGAFYPGTPVQIYHCNSTASQVWEFKSVAGGTEIHLVADMNYCLDVRGGVDANGTPVQIYPCNNTASQFWDPVQGNVGPTTRIFRSRLPGGRCLDVRGGVQADGTAVQIYDCNNTVSQDWFTF